MRFGVCLTNFGADATPAQLARSAKRVEELGYSCALVADHVALTPDTLAETPAPFYDPFTLLGWLAAVTTTIEIGTSVAVLPYRSPLLTARMATTIDQLSGGRMVLGVGSGWA